MEATDDNRLVLVEVERDGVRYRLTVSRLDPEVFALSSTDWVQLQPKVVAEKA